MAPRCPMRSTAPCDAESLQGCSQPYPEHPLISLSRPQAAVVSVECVSLTSRAQELFIAPRWPLLQHSPRSASNPPVDEQTPASSTVSSKTTRYVRRQREEVLTLLQLHESRRRSQRATDASIRREDGATGRPGRAQHHTIASGQRLEMAEWATGDRWTHLDRGQPFSRRTSSPPIRRDLGHDPATRHSASSKTKAPAKRLPLEGLNNILAGEGAPDGLWGRCWHCHIDHRRL